MRSVLPWTVMRRTASVLVSCSRTSSQLRTTSTTRATPPARTSGKRPGRRRAARVPEPASGDMGNALGQGWQLSGGELELAQRAAREEEARKRRPATRDGALQPLHHVPGEGERPLHEPAAAGEGGLSLLLQRGEVTHARGPEQDLGLSRRLGQRGGCPRVGLPVIEEGQGHAHADEQALVLTAGGDELVEHVTHPERR